MEQSYVNENAHARQRLESLAASMGDPDLRRRLPNGWTVADVFVHLAFWDFRQLALLKRWEETGVSPSPMDFDSVNEAVCAVSASVPPRAAVGLALTAAEAVDAKIERLPADLAAAIEQGGHERVLRRALHRNAHLDQIEKALESVLETAVEPRTNTDRHGQARIGPS